jgi:hypothetical protein
MKNTNCCIVIPIYKTTLEKTEIISLRQCLTILSNYQIVFITHQKLNCQYYNIICAEYNIDILYKYFPSYYFYGISGYNALLLSKHFYEQFLNYKYILIYQLDAYVFRDELEFWCNQDYDYIGSPWLSIKSITDIPTFGSKFGYIVGNGGLCLRKIESMIRFYSPEIMRMYILSICTTYFNLLAEKSKKNILLRIIHYIFYPLKLIFDKFNSKCGDAKNEDVVWAKILESHGKIPSGEIAALFSFEMYCDYLYELTNHKLPFSCHGWPEYYRYQLFWKKFIQL